MHHMVSVLRTGAGVSELTTSLSLGLSFSISSGLDSSAKEGAACPTGPKTQVGWGDVQLQDDSFRAAP